MKTVRRNSWEQSIRINYVAPCWIKSAIRTKEYETWLIEHGIEFGEQIDCAGAMMRIACDKGVNGEPMSTSSVEYLLISILRTFAHDHPKIICCPGLCGRRQGRLPRPVGRVLYQEAGYPAPNH